MTDSEAPQQRLRLSFAKRDTLRYISHLDLSRAWERAFRRARLPLAYSQGYNPRPRFQIAAALPVGVTGEAELLDIWLAAPLSPSKALSRLRPVLPEGLDAVHVAEVELKSKSLQSRMRAAEYRAVLRGAEPVEAIASRAGLLLGAPSLPRRREHKGKLQTYDLRPLIESLNVQAGPEGVQFFTMRLQASPAGAGRPDEVLDALGLSLAVQSIERIHLDLEPEDQARDES